MKDKTYIKSHVYEDIFVTNQFDWIALFKAYTNLLRQLFNFIV